MVSELALSVVDFEAQSVQTKACSIKAREQRLVGSESG